MLNIGQIEYANCTPLFHVLRKEFPDVDYNYISGVPAVLNDMLLSGGVDVCPSSSIEYAYHPRNYRIIPGISIASAGPVASVLLFSKVPIENLDGKKVLLSSESAASVNLLKILLGMRFGCFCEYEVTRQNGFTDDSAASALLLIGDSALKSSLAETAPYVYDLGEMWFSWTKYPFVFALWLCRVEKSDNEKLKTFARRLIQAKKIAAENLANIVSSAQTLSWMGSERLLTYWRENISYDFDDNAKNGLMLYYEKCCEAGLIAEVPELRFVTLDEG